MTIYYKILAKRVKQINNKKKMVWKEIISAQSLYQLQKNLKFYIGDKR
jgi:hypothetical protein